MEQYISTLSQLQLAVVAALAFAVVAQAAYYLFVYLRPVLNKTSAASSKLPPVSVIICARNEHDYLLQFLPKVLGQDYPEFEVIVVNDCSEDDTLMLLGQMEQTYSNLRHTSIELDRKFAHGKKLAITVGVKSAKYEHLVFTDADCYPESNRWLQRIISTYSSQTEIVLGYGGYENRKGLLNKLIRFDTLLVAMQYLGLAKARHPYMGVGRNLSYTRTSFFSKNGFQSHYHINSGDDDLFVNERANKLNTSIVTSPDSFTRSVPCTSFGHWVKQKKRHLTTWTSYRAGTKLLLGIEPASRLLFYITLVMLIYPCSMYVEAAVLYSLRLLIQLIVYKLNMRKFEERGFLILIPIFDIVLPVLQIAFNILNLRDKHN